MRQSKRRPRKKIETYIEVGIQSLNINKCCVCTQSGIQLHHIDGDPSNNQPANIAALCLLCHDLAEQGKSWTGLTRSLSPEIIRNRKKLWEDKNARDLGLQDAESYWKLESTIAKKKSRAPENYGVAFETLQEWEQLKHCLAANANSAEKALFFNIGHINEKFYITARAGLPEYQHDDFVKAFVRKRGALVIPLKKYLKPKQTVATFDEIPAERQRRAHAIIVELIEKRASFEEVGVHCEVMVNGLQPWPEVDLKYQIAAWLQYMAIVRHHLNLLGENAERVGDLLLNWEKQCILNEDQSTWTVTPYDGALARRLDRFRLVLLGKSEVVRSEFKGVFEKRIGIDFDAVVHEISENPAADDKWEAVFAETAKIIGKLSRPEHLDEVLKSINPVLSTRTFSAFKGGKCEEEVVVTTAKLPNRFSIMRPSGISGACDLKIDYHDSVKFHIKPIERPENPFDYIEKMRAQDLAAILADKRVTWIRRTEG